MKWILPILAAFALAVAILSSPVPIIASNAFANKMNGKGIGCSSGMNCMQDRYNAAMKKQGKKPKQ